jgi:hypothetical protein
MPPLTSRGRVRLDARDRSAGRGHSLRNNKYWNNMGFSYTRVFLIASAIVGVVGSGCSSDSPKRAGIASGCKLNSDCDSSLVCTFGFCHTACKETKDCPAGERCVSSKDGQVCQLTKEATCTYPTGCLGPLKCAVDSECRNQCTTDGECISGQICATGGYCAEHTEVDSSGNLKNAKKADAGTSTGGSSGAGGGGGSGGKGTGGSPSGGGDSGAGTGLTNLKPSNLVDLSWVDPTKLGDVVVSGVNCDVYSESQIWSCVDDKLLQKKIVTLADQSRLSVLVMKSLRIELSTIVKTYEHLPVVLVAVEDMNLLGSILVQPATAGGGYDITALSKGQGPGGGPAGTNDAAGGGASFCGLGGPGATEGTAAGTATKAYGTPELVPLVGGSSGGNGDLSGGTGSQNGGGGGAIQLVAGKSILLGSGGYITAGGAGGIFGGTNHQEAGGGGSGGAILIEAPIVTIQGILAVNGGGGGQGSGDSGADGRPDDQPALGGQNSTTSGIVSPGGDGSAAAVLNGTAGTRTAGAAAGGGGGGAGRIRINTKSGQVASTAAALSPASGTACMSVGTLK